MTQPAPNGFAMINDIGEIDATVYSSDLKRVLAGTYTINPDTFIAINTDNAQVLKVDFDAKNGVWFKVA